MKCFRFLIEQNILFCLFLNIGNNNIDFDQFYFSG